MLAFSQHHSCLKAWALATRCSPLMFSDRLSRVIQVSAQMSPPHWGSPDQSLLHIHSHTPLLPTPVSDFLLELINIGNPLVHLLVSLHKIISPVWQRLRLFYPQICPQHTEQHLEQCTTQYKNKKYLSESAESGLRLLFFFFLPVCELFAF